MVSISEPIDLRSDTVTKPTPEMLQAMMNAQVGDDVIDIDPTLQQLENLTAEILGKEAAIFMPSGTMSNQIALRLHCDRGSEFICEADCHIHHYEQGAYAQLSGLVAKTIAGQGGALTTESVEDTISPENEHFLRTRLLCLENTHNRWGGRIQSQAEIQKICSWAHQNALKTHLDGARLWNAAIASGLTEQELCEPFDSISVCFSKGLGAPVGSALAGPKSLIAEARRARKLFGGGMRQAGFLGAAALYSLQNHRERLIMDHQHAEQIGNACENNKAFKVRDHRIDTNIVICDVDASVTTAANVVDQLNRQGLQCLSMGRQTIRFVTHLNVSGQQIENACKIIETCV
ncbi:aminotransferase class I/II-fold pyridoxal phosphate-dependent enzyme [Rubripirellula sp.]|nr:GntG family PLP-dependent aldolase [Rubripirellula sp.]MDB4338541.1 aminotransferase class I/II-fold pyridoxal phosphate-dependent enzyme [Rubripirellula sp.]